MESRQQQNIKFLVIALITLLSFTNCNGQNQGNGSRITDAMKQKIDDYVKQYVNLDIFSGTVLVATDGIPIYEKPFGLSNRENNTPITLNTKFLIGSMNKTFTQVVILQLINEDRLRYSDRLIDFMNGFTQELVENITIEHLLNHKSGFGDYHNELYWKLPHEKKNINGIVELIKNAELNFPPGSEQEYSNSGYILLGAIIEKVTGKSYAQNVRERIVNPLRLKETYLERLSDIPDKSIGYLKTINGIENNLEMITEPRSDGGFWSTGQDILKFYYDFFYGEKMLRQKNKEGFEFFQQINPLYYEAGNAIPLAGGMNGANTVCVMMLKERNSIVVMANMDEPVAEKIAKGIKQIIMGADPDKPVLPAMLNIYKAYSEYGIEYVEKNFENLTVNFHQGDPKDAILNTIGYQLLQSKKMEDAINVFTLNTKLFPTVANCWDSLGEVLLINGDKDGALQAYKKALLINPNMQTAKAAVMLLQNK